MKKILLVMSAAIIIALFSAPSSVKAATDVGDALVTYMGVEYIADIYCDVIPTTLSLSYSSTYYDIVKANGSITLYLYIPDLLNTELFVGRDSYFISGFIPSLTNNQTLISRNNEYPFFNTYNDFENTLPDDLKPTLISKIWDDFYDLYYSIYGFYPVPGSLIDILRKLAGGDNTEDTEIIFPSSSPTPTPTPTPTPIPVQTIFVPDGNGNTTIIYQYPDPTTGVITQSPYNPNITNNIDINCDCDGDSDNGIFSPDPQDPATLTSSMLWADGFGVEISDNPLTAANESQKTLSEAASEYSDSVGVVSNSFNVLPVKWLTLVGLLGGILIIAGLIRTFLGG